MDGDRRHLGRAFDEAISTGGRASAMPDTVAAVSDPLVQPIEDGEHQEFAGIRIDLFQAGDARVKRLVYQPGGRWSEHVKPHVGTEWCEHAHVGFLVRGRLAGEYPDGCGFDYTAPTGVHIDPGHDSWVIGEEPAVLIEFDFGTSTVDRLGIAASHGHA